MPEDGVQPAPQVLHLAAVLQRGERAQEGLLDDVLGAPVGAQTGGESRQLSPVALHDDGKRLLLTIAASRTKRSSDCELKKRSDSQGLTPG